MDAVAAEKVREIIHGTRLHGHKHLGLSRHTIGAAIDWIPNDVFSLTHIESLDLSHHQLRRVPERIREMVNLRYLNLVGNPLEVLPDIPGLGIDWATFVRRGQGVAPQNILEMQIDLDEMGLLVPENSRNLQLSRELALLPALRRINVYSISKRRPIGNIREFINNLSALAELEELNFFNLLLGEVPTGIRSLNRLQALGFYRTGLREIPSWVGELQELRTLWLEHNSLTELPDSLANLKHLEGLYLDENRFTAIPEVVYKLHNLHSLWIQSRGSSHENVIRQIPSDILQLPRLQYLVTTGHPIETPPPEVVAQGVEAIKNYWRQQQESGVDYLAEAKLIIVGEAGAGKSTLARKIEDREYELKPQEPSTEGIDVIRWSFPSAVRIQREGAEEVRQTEFHASTWDFGGQEIYHATHQFFLTRRSLYALVTDDRKEDTDFNYWLQVVELLSDGSPLLIVQNEKQDRQRDIDLPTLRAHFPNLRDTFRINLATNRGLDSLVKTIRQELERLPHIGTPLPRTWSKVRAALETDPRHYISLDEYLAICEANGFTRREDKLQLSGYLHDLGICLHFQDDPVLKNTVVLKPKWGTDAVYRVLDDHTILDNRGRFGPADLARIWCDPEYAPMRDELLALMMRFQLCYPLPGTAVHIAPQMLSPSRPGYEWESKGGLVVRYDYEFMPKGILTRFIVAVNHLIEDQNLVWKTGVILAREGARAEVIEDYARRKITVRVIGADARGLLAIVDDQLERINASFPRMKYDKYLPCNCEICQASEEPYAYPLAELKDFSVEGDAIQCRVSRKLVDAENLLREVLPSAVRSIASDRIDSIFSRKGLWVPEAPAKEVYVSYAWTDESTSWVGKLQEALAVHGVTLVRDRNEMRYRESIRSFMERIGRGKCIVVVLSKRYLESENCMFELNEIAEHGDLEGRVFPIVLPDAEIHNARGRLRYIKHWEKKRNELDAEMKDVSGEYLQGIREELDLYAKIRHTIGRITDVLGDMNALPLTEHQASGFSALVQALEARLSE